MRGKYIELNSYSLWLFEDIIRDEKESYRLAVRVRAELICPSNSSKKSDSAEDFSARASPAAEVSEKFHPIFLIFPVGVFPSPKPVFARTPATAADSINSLLDIFFISYPVFLFQNKALFTKTNPTPARVCEPRCFFGSLIKSSDKAPASLAAMFASTCSISRIPGMTVDLREICNALCYLKRTLNGLQLFNHSENGVQIQFYALMTLSLLLFEFKQKNQRRKKRRRKKKSGTRQIRQNRSEK